MAADAVDVLHGEVDAGLARRSEQVRSTVLVVPPMATLRVLIAFSKALKLAIERGNTEASSFS